MWTPGCGSLSEIAMPRNGADIIKIFRFISRTEFIKSVKGLSLDKPYADRRSRTDCRKS